MRSLVLLILITLATDAVAAGQNLGVRTIVVKTEAQARDLRARIQKGESFEELARKYSADASATAGGYLGTFAVADLRKELQAGITGLHPGDVSPVLRVNGDYVLLQLLREEEARWQEQMAAGRRAFQQKRYAEAEQFFQASIREAERFGLQDARLGTSLNSLAILYFAQTNNAAAEPLYKRALSIRERALGPEHPDVGATLNNLAELYWSQKKYAAAQPLYQRALTIVEKTVGPESPELGAALNNLADVYRAQQSYAAAKPLYERVLRIKEKTLEPEHPDLG